MTPDKTVAQRMLKDGQDALRGGNRVRARALFLEAVSRDPDAEAAWWELSQVVEDPRERMRALENVVRLNPDDEVAHQQLVGLRQQQLAAAPPPAPVGAEWASRLPDAPLEPVDGIDDPYQCPYCGQPAGLDDRHCPACAHNLYRRAARNKPSGAAVTAALFLTLSVALGTLELLGPIIALGVAQRPADRAAYEMLLPAIIAGPVWGDFLKLDGPTARLLLEVIAARTLVLGVIVLALRRRWTAGYYAAIVASLANLLLALYLLIAGYAGPVAAGADAVMAVAALAALVGAADEFAVNQERILVKADTTARSPLDFYRRGHVYRQRGMWALAVAQWRKAVGLAPRVTRYYKDLGIGYAQIGRFERSRRVLEEAGRQAPEDAEIGEILALVNARAETDGLLRR